MENGKVTDVLGHDGAAVGYSRREYGVVALSAQLCALGGGDDVVAFVPEHLCQVAALLLIEQQLQRRGGSPRRLVSHPIPLPSSSFFPVPSSLSDRERTPLNPTHRPPSYA